MKFIIFDTNLFAKKFERFIKILSQQPKPFHYYLMFLCLLISLIASKIKLPKFSQFLVGEGLDSKVLEESLKYLKKNAKKICESENDDQYYIDLCIATYESMEQAKCSDPDNFNKVLSEFSKVNEFLIIIGSFNTDIDLSKLKTEMVVTITYDDDLDIDIDMAKSLESQNKYIKLLMKNARKMIQSHFDGSPKSILRYASLVFDNKKIKGDKIGTVPLIGDVKNKVSYLVIGASIVKITQSDLNAPRSLFAGCVIDKDSKKIKSKHFIADYSTQILMTETIKEKFEVGQYGILLGTMYEYSPYRINCNPQDWTVEYNSGSKWKSLNVKIPYKSASSFNLIVYTYSFNINNNANLDKYSPINISVLESIKMSPMAKKLDDGLQQIEITQTNFDDVPKDQRPSLTLSYDPEEFQFEKSTDDPFHISEESPFSYKPMNKKNINIGMIVGIVVAVVVVIAIVIVVVIIVLRKKKNAQQSASEGEGQHEDEA